MKPICVDEFIINPTSEVKPRITISPFSFQIINGTQFKDTELAEKYLENRFNMYHIEVKARYAIPNILKSLGLGSDDIVTILTTSGNYYISSCVTNAIETVCKWNREIVPNTRAIFVNHEFGYPFENIEELKTHNLPIIEDCVHSFIHDKQIGNVGDFVIYSLSKNYPMQIGAVVKQNNTILKYHSNITDIEKRFVLNNFSKYIPQLIKIEGQKKKNLLYLQHSLETDGITPFFRMPQSVVPNVFLFRINKNINLQELKNFMWDNGIESSVFYGKDAFFIPCNYTLSKHELDYMITLIRYYVKKVSL